jgi:cell division protein FtsX
MGLRVVEVFIKDGTQRAKKQAMAERIAAMPEVEAYAFVTKAQALARFRRRFGERITENLPVNPLPASFEILVREIGDVARVADRFYEDPIVDNDPGTHNGVKRAADPLLEEALPNP